MDDIQRKFTSQAETVYLGKVDSVQSFPGFGRVKLTWYISADPRIDQTIIYWNRRQDSVVKDFDRTSSGEVKDSIIIDSLPEGTSLFEFRNINKEGETSLYSSASVTVWGSLFGDGLHGRILKGFDFDYSQSLYTLTLSSVSENDDVLYSQINYTNGHGEKKMILIGRDTDSVQLEDFPNGDSLSFRNVFLPNQGIDTVYSNYKTYNAPVATFDKGNEISLVGNTDNQYFSRGDSSVYEWNTNGDLNVYAVNSDGSLEKNQTLPAIVPRSSFNFFFFYDADKFLGITTANALEMKQIVDGALVSVKPSNGQEAFGSGFNFIRYIPAAGFFFSETSGTGDIKTWFANDNATFDTPNGATVATGFTQYTTLSLFNDQTLLAVDSAGHLWSMPVSANGAIGSKSRIGIGWDRFDKLICVGTKLFCMEGNGNFYVFNNFNPDGSKFWIVN